MPRLLLLALAVGVVLSFCRAEVAKTASALVPLVGRRQLAASETGDGDVLCDWYNTMPAAGKAAATNWCGAKSGAGSYVNGPCTGTAGAWLGVTCAVVGGASRVTKLFMILGLGSSGLGGSLPTSIGGLDALTYLELGFNALTGSIPSSLGGLTRLTYLDLFGNSLSGSIPSSLGGLTGLTALWLYGNSLSGSIPTSLGGLTGLSTLNLSFNSLSGSIPSSLEGLTRLTYLDLMRNSLSGSIPSSLGALTGLTYLGLYSNSLTGSIPLSVGALTGLTYLGLDSNSLSGSIPASFCNLQPSIVLYVQTNPGLTCYPSCLSTISNFFKDSSIAPYSYGKRGRRARPCPLPSPNHFPPSLHLTSTNHVAPAIFFPPAALIRPETADSDIVCDFYNTMPATGKARLTNWCGAKSGCNYVSGPCTGTAGAWLGVTCAVVVVGGASRVTVLSLSVGSGGSLPTSIGGLDALAYLDLSFNSLSGSIPSSLEGLTRLTYLDLMRNSLSGSIPSSLGALTKLTYLSLSSNSLTGSIPSSLGGLNRADLA